ncbi:ATP-binding protein [Niallia circulans]
MKKARNPFFTTKDNGTGLGLAVCYRIAERHRARIKVHTSESGTKFSVYFEIEEGK